jgi:putative hydrolase of HD superfamily
MNHNPAQEERLSRQMEFIVEIDKLKQVARRTLPVNADRNENSAEHSWHVALMVFLLAEYATDRGMDVLRTIKMMLVHDLVEIDAGDTYCYDEEAGRDRLERETRAADRIFGMLPPDQASEMRGLWEEFEACRTRESRFANALDRLQALLLNYHTGGKTWTKHSIKSGQVVARALPIEDGSCSLWEYARGLIDRAVGEGLLAP